MTPYYKLEQIISYCRKKGNSFIPVHNPQTLGSVYSKDKSLYDQEFVIPLKYTPSTSDYSGVYLTSIKRPNDDDIYKGLLHLFCRSKYEKNIKELTYNRYKFVPNKLSEEVINKIIFIIKRHGHKKYHNFSWLPFFLDKKEMFEDIRKSEQKVEKKLNNIRFTPPVQENDEPHRNMEELLYGEPDTEAAIATHVFQTIGLEITPTNRTRRNR